MKITKHQPDDDGFIRINNCIAVIVMGIRDDKPTLWAVTDPLGVKGELVSFEAKYEGDDVTLPQLGRYKGSIIDGNVAWHLFSEENKILHADGAGMPRGGMPPTKGNDMPGGFKVRQ